MPGITGNSCMKMTRGYNYWCIVICSLFIHFGQLTVVHKRTTARLELGSATIDVAAQEGPGIVIAHPGQNVELLCTVTVTDSGSQTAGWLINNSMGPYRINHIRSGILAGHTTTLDSNNLIVENIMMNDDRNGSDYRCVIVPSTGTLSFANIIEESDPIILYVAATNSSVTAVMSPITTITTTSGVSTSTAAATTKTTIATTTTSKAATTPATTIIKTTAFLSASSFIATSIQPITSSGAQSTIIIPSATPNSVPPVVPRVAIDRNTININGNNVTLTLSWGEPFNNLDPIVNYTVSCSGDVTCPSNFTTTDSTVRSYTITNLPPMTNYIFSVVTTNSIGSGKAGVVMITTPPAIHQVTGIELTCKPVGLINQCIVTWDALTEGNITQYQVIYNETIIRVDGSTTTLKFIAPSLPDDEHDGVVMVAVIAINQFGLGPESDPEFTTVIASSVINAVTLLNAPNANNELHSITVNCTIRPESEADQCVVMAVADGRMNTTGSAPIIDGMAVVTVHLLHCEMTYNIIAEGRDSNGTLVGPGSSYKNITTGLCPSCESDDELSTELIIIISVVVTFIITLVVTALITHIITSLCYKRWCKTVEFKKIKADNSDKNDSKQSFQCDDNSRYENIPTIKRVQADTEPEYATTSVVKVDTSDIRMDSNPAYVATDL